MNNRLALCASVLSVSVAAAQGVSRAAVELAPVHGSNSPVTVRYLGTAGWAISDGSTTLLVDPYISRNMRESGGPTNPQAADEVVTPDTNAIDAHVARADYVLVTHSHADHLLDVPYIARKKGATVIGSQSTANVVLAGGVPRNHVLIVRGGEDYEFGQFSVRVIPSLHSPLRHKLYFNAGAIPREVTLPMRRGQYAEGGTLAYLVRIGGHEILVFGGMNYIEREIQGLRPDVVMVGANESRLDIHDFTGRLLRALGFPPFVFPTHWDAWTLPLDAPQTSALAKLEAFKQEVMAVSAKSRVPVLAYFEPFTLPSRPPIRP